MFQIEKVLERDMDLYVINKFINDEKFKNLFLHKISLSGFELDNCLHSYSDEDGESDITIVLKNEKNDKIGLLIEDKISAIAMPNQYERYKIRGDKMIENGVFSKYFIFIIAPFDYLNTNLEAQKYDNKVSYEELLVQIKGDLFGENLIKEAIREKKKGYNVIENKSVTLFWKKYYNLIDSRYNILKITKHDGARGSNAQWPIFVTPIKDIRIFHKSNKGFVDLQFPYVSDKYFEVYDIVKDELEEYMTLQKTGSSLSIRINVPIINFKIDFDEQIESIIECLNAVVKLQDFTRKIDCKAILELRD